MKLFKGILQIPIGLIQATGAILYLIVAFGVGFQHQTHLVGGFLVAQTGVNGLSLITVALTGVVTVTSMLLFRKDDGC